MERGSLSEMLHGMRLIYMAAAESPANEMASAEKGNWMESL